MIVAHFALYRIASHHKHSCIVLCPNCCMAFFFIRVDAANEAVYELVAKPVQKPSAGEPQPGEVIDQAPEEATNPADLQCKPRSITPTLKLMQCVI